MLTLSLAAALLLAQDQAGAFTPADFDKQPVHVSLGYTRDSGLLVDFQLTPCLGAAYCINYENRRLGHLLGRSITRLPGGFSKLDVLDADIPVLSERYIGMAYLLRNIELGSTRLSIGPGLGDRSRRIRSENAWGEAGVAGVGLLGRWLFPVADHWAITAEAGADALFMPLGVAWEKNDLALEPNHVLKGTKAFADVRGRLELQWGSSAALGFLWEKVFTKKPPPLMTGVSRKGFDLDNQWTAYASIRLGALDASEPQPAGTAPASATDTMVSTVTDLAQSQIEQRVLGQDLATIIHGDSRLPDYVLALTLSAGQTGIMAWAGEGSFANNVGRDIMDAPVSTSRSSAGALTTGSIDLTYFGPRHYYAGAGLWAIGGGGSSATTRYVIASAGREEALDIKKSGFGIGLRGGFQTALWGTLLGYAGLQTGVAALEFHATSRACTTARSPSFDSPCAVTPAGKSESPALMLQPHAGLLFLWDRVSTSIEEPTDGSKIRVAGGLMIFVEVFWNQFLFDYARANDGRVLKANNQPVHVALNGPGFFIGGGYMFGVGGKGSAAEGN